MPPPLLAFPLGADSPCQGDMTRSDRGDRDRCPRRGRMRGQILDWVRCTQGIISPPAGGEFLSQRWERNQWPRPPSLAPSGQFTLRIAGGRLRMGTACPYSPYPGPHYGGRPIVRCCWISGAQKGSSLRDSFRATGPWVCKNCRWCGSTPAPGFPEPTLMVRFPL